MNNGKGYWSWQPRKNRWLHRCHRKDGREIVLSREHFGYGIRPNPGCPICEEEPPNLGFPPHLSTTDIAVGLLKTLRLAEAVCEAVTAAGDDPWPQPVQERVKRLARRWSRFRFAI